MPEEGERQRAEGRVATPWRNREPRTEREGGEKGRGIVGADKSALPP